MSMDEQKASQIYDLGKAATIAKLIELDTKIDILTDRITRLEKNSSNSSKPPSIDIVKPQGNRAERRRAEKQKRKIGG
ncbi:MAG: hypothetical protein JW795_21180 [Chitinivibrionales bacterium]|nr:hypothetical protein [Chitinivibrionales bacterium]